VQPPRLGQSHYFSGKAKFFGQKPTAKNEKKIVFMKEKNGIHSVWRDEVPEIRDL